MKDTISSHLFWLVLLALPQPALGQETSMAKWYEHPPKNRLTSKIASEYWVEVNKLARTKNATEGTHANLHHTGSLTGRKSLTYLETFSLDSAYFVRIGERMYYDNLIAAEYDRYLSGGTLDRYYEMMHFALEAGDNWSDDDQRILELAIEHFISIGDAHSADMVASHLQEVYERNSYAEGNKLEMKTIRAYLGFFLNSEGLELGTNGEERPVPKADVVALFKKTPVLAPDGRRANQFAGGFASLQALCMEHIMPAVLEWSRKKDVLDLRDEALVIDLGFARWLAQTMDTSHVRVIAPLLEHKRSRLLMKSVMTTMKIASDFGCVGKMFPLQYAQVTALANGDAQMLWYIGDDWDRFRNTFLLKAENIIADGTTTRAMAIARAWTGPGDWNALRRLGGILESTQDHAAAAHFYDLAIHHVPTALNKDTVAEINMHRLACDFFAKQKPRATKMGDPKGGTGINTQATAGLLLASTDDRLLVTDVIDGSGAQLAGFLPGDRIRKVGDKAYAPDVPMRDWAHLLRGYTNSGVQVEVERLGNGAPISAFVDFIHLPLLTAEVSKEQLSEAMNKGGLLDHVGRQTRSYERRAADESALLDTTFKQVRTWPAIAQNAALLQRVNRCLEIINRMAKEPIDGKTFGDVDMSLGLVAALAQIVSDSKVNRAQMGGLGSVATTLSELAENPLAKEAAENVAPVNPADNSAGEVALDEGVIIVEPPVTSRCDIAGFYRCVEVSGREWGKGYTGPVRKDQCDVIGNRVEGSAGRATWWREVTFHVAVSGSAVEVTFTNQSSSYTSVSKFSGDLKEDHIVFGNSRTATTSFSDQFNAGRQSTTQFSFELEQIEILGDCRLKWIQRGSVQGSTSDIVQHFDIVTILDRKR